MTDTADTAIVLPLRLNLGCGTPGARSWHPIHGMVNLDKSMGWRFEDGLVDYADGAVAGLTVSHALMYVALSDWPAMFAEFARVLCDGGVIRITEDNTEDSRSRTYKKGWHDAVTLTYPGMVKAHLEAAGLTAVDCDAEHSHFADDSLRQSQHGERPDVFYAEGLRQTRVLFSPHNDDETLFASYTILRYRPMLVTCFGSAGDYGDTAMRAAETADAMSVLGAKSVEQWNGGDLVAQMRELDARVKPSKVFAPDRNTSHRDHLAVAEAALDVFGNRLVGYHTYNADGKVREGKPAEFELEWVQAKLRALARYRSQILHPRANQFFTQDLTEYIAE